MHLRGKALQEVVQRLVDGRLCEDIEVIEDEDERLGQRLGNLVYEDGNRPLNLGCRIGLPFEEAAHGLPTRGRQPAQGGGEGQQKVERLVVDFVQGEPGQR